jgi:hypothetical protein
MTAMTALAVVGDDALVFVGRRGFFRFLVLLGHQGQHTAATGAKVGWAPPTKRL